MYLIKYSETKEWDFADTSILKVGQGSCKLGLSGRFREVRNE